ncbi:hypothetical protein GCM10018781_25780 [Kitasatospora indigofera]|uniref:Uncharacterized protein n=1 Tax=Kitasatospora indigofera TaxID=67307 RepID=A0A919FM07_9ACTN|nr:hypothetical protein GCM10018781_25780 [Kitasatospora indigofera]
MRDPYGYGFAGNPDELVGGEYRIEHLGSDPGHGAPLLLSGAGSGACGHRTPCLSREAVQVMLHPDVTTLQAVGKGELRCRAARPAATAGRGRAGPERARPPAPTSPRPAIPGNPPRNAREFRRGPGGLGPARPSGGPRRNWRGRWISPR